MTLLNRILLIFLVTTVLLASTTGTQAQVTFWTPGGANTNFNNPGNWNNGVPGINDEAHFGVGSPFTVTMNVAANIDRFTHSIGNMTMNGGNDLKINTESSINSILTVTGNDTRFIQLGNFNIGSAELGSMTIQNQAELEVAERIRLGSNPGIDGELIVSGSGTSTLVDQLRVGQLGNGELRVQSGAVVSADRTRIGFNIGSTGDVVVIGMGSLLQNTSSLSLGHFGGTGALTVSSGGRVTSNTQINIGNALDSNGMINLTGSSSTLEANELFVGVEGDGELDMTTGSQADFSNLVVIGDGASATGTLNVSSQAELTTGSIAVADLGTGSFNITNGGIVNCNGIIVGNGANAIGSINVDDASLDCSSLLLGSGDGNVIIQNGSEVSVAGITFVAPGFDLIFQDPGVDDNNELLNANGGLSVSGRVLIFSGHSDIDGDVETIGNGEFRVGPSTNSIGTVFGDLDNNGSRVFVGPSTTLNVIGQVSGAAPFEGTGDINLIGGISPGNGVGFQEFEGNVDFFVNSEIDIEIGGTLPGSQYDQIQFANNVLLRGNLNVSSVNNFQPLPGQQFTIMTIDGVRTSTLNGLGQGELVATIGDTGLEIDYFGGDGNDIVLNAVSSSVLLGDVNLDGVVDLLDVAPFVDLVSSGIYQAEADIDQNGVVDLLDVAPFVAILTGS